MEAMRAGIPIIATRISAIPELLGECGTLVNPDAPDEISAALAKFHDDPAPYQQRALQGIDILRRDYDLQRNHLRFKDLLRTLSTRPGPSN
jgi:glycosyltransferase involved in cell wall biosynthesis